MKKSFLLIFLIISLQMSANAQTPSPKRKKIAICYFGLTRSTKKVYPSHFDHIFNVLDRHNIDYDVFMHTWQLEDKQRVWCDYINCEVDYTEHKHLNPNHYKIDNQEEFTSKLVWKDYFYQHVWDEVGHDVDGEWLPELILNHLCALESQKRVTEMVENCNEKYDLVMYVRPDVWFNNPLDIDSILSLKDREIIIPNFSHNEGINDRFAVLTYSTAPIYGKRIEKIVDYRRNNGRIVSEKYLKYVCDKNKLKIHLIDFRFKIVRPQL